MKPMVFPVKEIAERYEVDPKTVYEWIKKGLKTEKHKMSGTRTRHMIALGDVDFFIEGANNG